MTTRPTSPGPVTITFVLTGDDAKQFRLMAKEAKQVNSVLAKSLIRELIADDRAAHSGKGQRGLLG